MWQTQRGRCLVLVVRSSTPPVSTHGLEMLLLAFPVLLTKMGEAAEDCGTINFHLTNRSALPTLRSIT